MFFFSNTFKPSQNVFLISQRPSGHWNLRILGILSILFIILANFRPNCGLLWAMFRTFRPSKNVPDYQKNQFFWAFFLKSYKLCKKTFCSVQCIQELSESDKIEIFMEFTFLQEMHQKLICYRGSAKKTQKVPKNGNLVLKMP